jgi:hypothetical protein
MFLLIIIFIRFRLLKELVAVFSRIEETDGIKISDSSVVIKLLGQCRLIISVFFFFFFNNIYQDRLNHIIENKPLYLPFYLPLHQFLIISAEATTMPDLRYGHVTWGVLNI